MGALNYGGIVKVLKQSAKLVRATRRLLQSVGVVFPHMSELEVELRQRATEVEAHAQMLKDDTDRPLLGQGEGKN